MGVAAKLNAGEKAIKNRKLGKSNSNKNNSNNESSNKNNSNNERYIGSYRVIGGKVYREDEITNELDQQFHEEQNIKSQKDVKYSTAPAERYKDVKFTGGSDTSSKQAVASANIRLQELERKKGGLTKLDVTMEKAKLEKELTGIQETRAKITQQFASLYKDPKKQKEIIEAAGFEVSYETVADSNKKKITGTYSEAEKTKSKFITAFKGGFNFEPVSKFNIQQSAYYVDKRSLKERVGESKVVAGYVSGIGVGIASLSYDVWKGVGAKVAKVAYASPKVISAAEKISKVVGSRAGRFGQKALTGIYIAKKGSDIYTAGKQEGSFGAARESIKLLRTGVVVKGLSSGFAKGIKEASGETYYFVKGASASKTKVSDGGFKTDVSAKGKISEFYKGKMRREFDFVDVSKVSGKSKELVRFVNPTETPYGESKVLVSGKYYSSLVASDVNVALKGKSYGQYKSISGVKAYQVSKDIPLVEDLSTGRSVGIGGSKTKFKEAKNIFQDGKKLTLVGQQLTQGTGKSSYQYVSEGDVVRVGGKLSTVDPKVVSRFDFKESISRIGKDLGGINLVDDYDAVSKIVTDQVSKSLVAKVSKNVLSPSLKPVVVPVAKTSKTDVVNIIPSQKSKVSSSDVSSVVKVRQDFSKPIVVTKMQPVSKVREKQDVILTETLVEPISETKTKSKTVSRTRLGLDFQNIADVETAVGIKQDVAYAVDTVEKSRRQMPVQLPVTRQKVMIDNGQVISTDFGYGNIIPSVPSRFGGGFNLPKLPESKERKSFESKSSQSLFSGSYVPTIEAELFGITGKKPTKKSIQSGVRLRPIIKL